MSRMENGPNRSADVWKNAGEGWRRSMGRGLIIWPSNLFSRKRQRTQFFLICLIIGLILGIQICSRTIAVVSSTPVWCSLCLVKQKSLAYFDSLGKNAGKLLPNCSVASLTRLPTTITPSLFSFGPNDIKSVCHFVSFFCSCFIQHNSAFLMFSALLVFTLMKCLLATDPSTMAVTFNNLLVSLNLSIEINFPMSTTFSTSFTERVWTSLSSESPSYLFLIDWPKSSPWAHQSHLLAGGILESLCFLR